MITLVEVMVHNLAQACHSLLLSTSAATFSYPQPFTLGSTFLQVSRPAIFKLTSRSPLTLPTSISLADTWSSSPNPHLQPIALSAAHFMYGSRSFDSLSGHCSCHVAFFISSELLFSESCCLVSAPAFLPIWTSPRLILATLWI